jgi:hypothetical protein
MPLTLTTGAMTELDAVNELLQSIGQAPVNTLEVSNIKDVSFARLTLNNTLREVLTRGWSFNVDEEFSLVPDVANNILLPTDALDIDCTDTTRNLVWRDGKLYDVDEGTFEITSTDLKFRIVRHLAFEKIPQPARNFVTAKAGRVFQSRIVGSQILYQFTKEMEIDAYAEFLRSEHRQRDLNMFRSPTRVNRIFTRR